MKIFTDDKIKKSTHIFMLVNDNIIKIVIAPDLLWPSIRNTVANNLGEVK